MQEAVQVMGFLISAHTSAVWRPVNNLLHRLGAHEMSKPWGLSATGRPRNSHIGAAPPWQVREMPCHVRKGCAGSPEHRPQSDLARCDVPSTASGEHFSWPASLWSGTLLTLGEDLPGRRIYRRNVPPLRVRSYDAHDGFPVGGGSISCPPEGVKCPVVHPQTSASGGKV